MAGAAALTVAEELLPLWCVSHARDWSLILVEPTEFILTLPAKDGSSVQLQVDCADYPGIPPAWHFRSPISGCLDLRPDIPRGGGFFHGAGVICAPWNRLAYKSYEPNGPHADWLISDWKSNPHTGAATTLCAMALRIAVELQGAYEGRLE